MTIDQLLDKLDWTRTVRPDSYNSDLIRFPNPRHRWAGSVCPIEAAGGHYIHKDGRLGLNRDDRDNIMHAADISLNDMLNTWSIDSERLRVVAPLRLSMRLRMLNIEDPR